MDDYNNLVKMSHKAQIYLKNNIYDDIFFNKIINLMYYYQTVICFDNSSDIYSYCSEQNIRKIHKIELLFKEIILLIETSKDNFYIKLTNRFIRLSHLIINYLKNFNNN